MNDDGMEPSFEALGAGGTSSGVHSGCAVTWGQRRCESTELFLSQEAHFVFSATRRAKQSTATIPDLHFETCGSAQNTLISARTLPGNLPSRQVDN